MIQIVFAALMLFMVATPARAAGMRDSGTLVRVAPDGSSIVLKEMGVWQGPGIGVLTRSIHVPPSATVSLLEHTGRWEGPTPGWNSQSVDVSSLRPGDFVTVTFETGQSGEAMALQVVRPEP